jgi:1,4-dihydroxy-2-naphthoate octaprenyltransferase
MAMTRPTHIALIVVIFANGALLAQWRGSGAPMDAVAIGTAVVLLILASAAVHLANEAADDESDRLTGRTPFSGGSGGLQASSLSPRVPLVASLIVAVVVAVATLGVAVIGVLDALASMLLMVGLAGGLAYSLPPLALARRGSGEPLNAVLGAFVLPLFGVATVAAAVEPADMVAFLPFLCVTFASVLATAWPDRGADAATGKATLQVRFGTRPLRLIALGTFAAFVIGTGLSAAIDAMPFAMAGLLVTPLLVVGLMRYTRYESPLANVAAMVSLAVITSAALLASIVGHAGRPGVRTRATRPSSCSELSELVTTP